MILNLKIKKFKLFQLLILTQKLKFSKFEKQKTNKKNGMETKKNHINISIRAHLLY